MTGIFITLTERQKARIKIFTEQGLSIAVMVERLGLSRDQIYHYQVKSGLRIRKKRGNDGKGKTGIFKEF